MWPSTWEGFGSIQPEPARVGLSQGYPLERVPQVSQLRYLGQGIVLRCVNGLLILLPNFGQVGQDYCERTP